MAQHDQVIDNGSGLAVRTDINAALAALFSSNSGPIEPTTTVPGQVWFDTASPDTARLWLRNGSNSAWVRMFDISAATIGFGTRTGPDRFVWNDQADLSGTDIATLDELGNFETSGSLTVNGAYNLTAADLSFGSRLAGTPAGSLNRFVINNGQNLSGTDVVSVDETGTIIASSAIFANNVFGTREGYATGVGALYSTLKQGEALGGPYIAMRGQTYTVSADRGGMELATSTGMALKLNPSRSARFGLNCGFMNDANFQMTGDANQYLVQFDGNHMWLYQRSTGDMLWYRSGSTAFQLRQSDGAMIQWTGTAYKPGGGPWGDSSDVRIKNVLGNYEHGLDEILTLQPVRYTFKGNDTGQLPPVLEPRTDDEGNLLPSEEVAAESSDPPYKNSPHYQAAIDGTEFIGLVAQDTETVFPEMVAQVAGTIDGVEVTDLRNLDTTPLVYALVNAVKTLTARIEALEAA